MTGETPEVEKDKVPGLQGLNPGPPIFDEFPGVRRRGVVMLAAVGDAKAPDRIYALCDDGTMWLKCQLVTPGVKLGPWTEIENVPQPEPDPIPPLP